MRPLKVDVLVIGSGPAGLAAATQARRDGAGRVVILERNREAGGILPQCIHNGFGLRVFGRDLTGPEYAQRWKQQAADAGVTVLTRTMVLSIAPELQVSAMGNGRLLDIDAKAIVLATGCRERPRGALSIPGTRPAGIYTAGTAQRLVNIEGFMPGKRFVILGSGDIGMIMARRLTLEGSQVLAMAEILPYVSGLKRNLVQCVRDYDIPLYTSTTITEIRGRDRVESVVLCAVDDRWRPIAGTERAVACDTLLLSVGLIPEIELARLASVSLDPLTGGALVDEHLSTNVPGIYAAGNMVHVYDLVDSVSESAQRAGRFAAQAALRQPPPREELIPVVAGDNVHHVVPQRLRPRAAASEQAILELRVSRPMEEPVAVRLFADNSLVHSERLRYSRPSEMISLALQPEHAQRLAQAAQLLIEVIPMALHKES